MGNILITIFTSSTSVKVDKLHLFNKAVPVIVAVSESLIAALSKKLPRKGR